ncbi:MAG: hypothetical protein U9Q16_01650 [Patescibacteria group bacterium]|nr:hypothetical protein [Patescibacteria group bacterium]
MKLFKLPKNHLSKLFFSLLAFCFLIPLTTQAWIMKNPFAFETFTELSYAIIDFLFYLALAIAPIMIIIAGFHFITAMGDPAKILIAKKIVLWTLIGLLVIISSKGLIALVQTIFKVEEPTTMLQDSYAYVKNMVSLSYIL